MEPYCLRAMQVTVTGKRPVFDMCVCVCAGSSSEQTGEHREPPTPG